MMSAEIEVTENKTQHYLQQYLAEREALFSHSRNISVGEMATALAHEINQPIGAVGNLLQGIDIRLKGENIDVEQIRSSINSAIEQNHFAARIITRIRDFTHARQPQFTTLHVNTLLSDSVRLLDWVFSMNKVTVDIHCDPTLQLKGDFTILQQVITNLLRNSVEASVTDNTSGFKPKIVISAVRHENKILVKIEDNGSGISDDKTLFTPFVTTKSEGLGIGLNICRSFIELHQGRLWLTQAECRGCIAHIQLPGLTENEIDGENNAK